MSAPTAKERWIAQQLELTDAGLYALLRIHRGDGISGGTAGVRLERQGFVTPWLRETGGRLLTDKGRARLDEARRMGY